MRMFAAALLCVLSASAEEFPAGSKITQIEVKEGAKTVTVSPANADATVLIFISTQCPISNSYNERMSALYKDYAGKNVQLVFVNANANESPAEIAEHANANKFPFPVYKDAANTLADKFGATVTPETYVFDKAGVLRYHGSIDDAQNEARVKVRGLRSAIEAVLNGKIVDPERTKAFGCTLHRART